MVAGSHTVTGTNAVHLFILCMPVTARSSQPITPLAGFLRAPIKDSHPLACIGEPEVSDVFRSCFYPLIIISSFINAGTLIEVTRLLMGK